MSVSLCACLFECMCVCVRVCVFVFVRGAKGVKKCFHGTCNQNPTPKRKHGRVLIHQHAQPKNSGAETFLRLALSRRTHFNQQQQGPKSLPQTTILRTSAVVVVVVVVPSRKLMPIFVKITW